MDDADKLERLRKRLMTTGLPSQVALARGAGVDQPLVSRALNGELKRFTPRVGRLADYVDKRIATMRKATVAGARGAATRPDRKSTGQTAVLALRSCREYLDDGHDPKVLLDQVAILRRAQTTAAGRPRRGR